MKLNEVSYIFAILSYTTLVKELPIFTVSLAFPSPKVYPKVHSFSVYNQSLLSPCFPVLGHYFHHWNLYSKIQRQCNEWWGRDGVFLRVPVHAFLDFHWDSRSQLVYDALVILRVLIIFIIFLTLKILYFIWLIVYLVKNSKILFFSFILAKYSFQLLRLLNAMTGHGKDYTNTF